MTTEPDDMENDPDSERPNGKVRSETAYPYYGLTTALTVVDAVRKSGGSEAPSSAVMAQMGVPKVTDRRWAYGIPAAIQFGLIERVGRGDDGRIKLTDLATRIALPTTPEEGMAAKVAAFRTPPLYSKLLERFAGHPVPQKEGLRNLLFREFGIVESMAAYAAEAFLDSLKDAGLINANNSISVNGVAALAADKGASAATEKTAIEKTAADHQPPPGMQLLKVPNEFIIYKCKISGGRIIEIPLPPKFTTTDVDKLHAFLKTQIDDEPVQESQPS
jgi:hypothetical protein